MPVMTQHRPGTFSWIDLAAHDLDAAERYYTQMFGWTADRMPFGPGENDVYVMLRKDGRDAAAVYTMDPAQKSQGMPSAWLSYVTVESADAAAAKARELGGTIVADAFDVLDVGRMALIGDPAGALFAVWQAGRHIGAGVAGEPGSLCWNELATSDMDRAIRFYSDLFGWTGVPFEGSPVPYTMMMLDGQTAAGGIYTLPAEMQGMPPHWAPYFAVEDTDASVARSDELGGTTIMPPHDIPTVGRFALLRDPQGAMFYIIRLAATQS
ncbi:MAG TPA: VOC family protein [Longimicrobium sp.]|nr:VOC family protein [Longimicrobium sp.]